MSVLWGIVSIVAVFGLVIITHEVGHFTMCKLCGIYVYKFSIGMGPKLLSYKGKETEYALRLFPIGGSVQMMGEDEESENPRSFNKKKVWQRSLVLVAGSLMNLLAAVVIFIILFMMIGTPSGSNEVGALVEGQAAEAAGVLPGDIIVEINEQPVKVWADISPAVALRELGEPIEVVVQRQGENVSLTIMPYFEEEDGRWLIGIFPAVERQNFFTAIDLGVRQSFIFTRDLIINLFGMVSGQVEPDVSGPVGVGALIFAVSSRGIKWILNITAIFCVNLAVVNMLPIPALDGARIIFLVAEKLRGKPVNREVEGMIHFVGLMMLFALMIFLTVRDISRIKEIMSIFG